MANTALPNTDFSISAPSDFSETVRGPSASALPEPLPSLEEMMGTLKQSGVLLAELDVHGSPQQPVDHSPLAALQPGAAPQTDEAFSDVSTESTESALAPIVLANSSQATGNSTPPAAVVTSKPFPMLSIINVLLLAQVLQASIQLLHFFLVQYPRLEQLIVMGQFGPSLMSSYFSKGAALGVSFGVSLAYLLFQALRKPNGLQKIILVLGIGLIGSNFLIQTSFIRPEFASGNPLQLPDVISEIFASRKSASSLPNQAPEASPILDF